MRNERFLTPTSFVGVLLAHIALLVAVSQFQPKQPEVSQDIQFVDLADLDPPGSSGAEAGPAPEPPPVQKEPPKKERPKPIVKEEPKVKPVVSKDKKADLKLPDEKPKPQEKPQPEPPKKVEQAAAPKPAGPPPAHTAPDGKGTGEGKNPNADSNTKGSGDGKGQGSGSGKGGGNASGDGQGSSAGNPLKANGTIPRPPYPAIARENGEEGTVVLKVLVAPGGRVQKVDIAKSSRSAALDRAAKKAAQNGHFSTTAWTEFRVSVAFRLD